MTNLAVCERQARVVAADARAALDAIRGLPVVRAVAKLRFGPGRTCEPVARVVDKAMAKAERAGIAAELLVVAGGSATEAEDIVRVRRKAHGKADWISSPTADVRVELRPAALRDDPGAWVEPPVAAPPPIPAPREPDAGAEAVREALFEVIDPDLGVNIVDLGFVRDVTMAGDCALITLTLTSAACPLTKIMADQIRTVLCDKEFRIEWQWLPAWRPADISADGREQLQAIGFSF
jgi:metal-sulfur cluster biosynthetic enzyme/ribosomal protein L22